MAMSMCPSAPRAPAMRIRTPKNAGQIGHGLAISCKESNSKHLSYASSCNHQFVSIEDAAGAKCKRRGHRHRNDIEEVSINPRTDTSISSDQRSFKTQSPASSLTGSHIGLHSAPNFATHSFSFEVPRKAKQHSFVTSSGRIQGKTRGNDVWWH